MGGLVAHRAMPNESKSAWPKVMLGEYVHPASLALAVFNGFAFTGTAHIPHARICPATHQRPVLGRDYALIAVGYTMVYGVLRLINFAHGDVFMFGAMMGMYVCTGSFDAIQVGVAHPLFWGSIAFTPVAVLLGLLILYLAERPSPKWLQWLGKVAGAVVLSVAVMDLGGRLVRWIGMPSWIAFGATLIVAMIVCASLGIVIELIAYRPLRNRPRITSLITAIGVSMFLEFGGQGFFGPTKQSFPHLAPISESATVIPPGQVSLTFNVALGWLSPKIGTVSVARVDAMIVGITMVLMAVLTYIVLRTRTGLALRAVSFRFDTASLMGIDVNRIITFTFALGSALAGAAGVLVAIHYPQVDPLMGLMPGIKAFVAAALGGIGNIPGAVAGGFLLGLVEVLVSAYLPQGSQYRDAIAFVILIAILLVKPTGLFGRNLVEKV